MVENAHAQSISAIFLHVVGSGRESAAGNDCMPT